MKSSMLQNSKLLGRHVHVQKVWDFGTSQILGFRVSDSEHVPASKAGVRPAE